MIFFTERHEENETRNVFSMYSCASCIQGELLSHSKGRELDRSSRKISRKATKAARLLRLVCCGYSDYNPRKKLLSSWRADVEKPADARC